MRRVLVLGGSGFIGRQVCARAGAPDLRLSVATRRAAHARPVQMLPWVDVLPLDPYDEAALADALQGHDAVINLIAILHGDAAAFERAHVQLPGVLARACQRAGVRRCVHVSALGASLQGPSMYQRSKARGEAVLAAAGLDLSVLRPSVVFGADDSFLNLFARLQRVLPLMPLAGADTRFQPVWVDDLARAIALLLHPAATPRPGVIEACGPEVFTLRQLVQQAGHWSGHPRAVISLPASLAKLQATVMEWMPGPPLMSRDNLASLSVDNVATPGMPGLDALGLHVASLRDVAPAYLSPAGSDPLSVARRSAGRG